MARVLRSISLVTALLLVSGFTECYKPVTKSQLPPHIKTVAVPAFQNNALRFKIEHRFTQAVMNELIHRGHGIRVKSEREGADAVIDGVVDRKSTRLNSSHSQISYAVFCLKKKKKRKNEL